MKKIAIKISVGILAVVGLGFYFYPIAEQAYVTRDWNTYTDERFGFTLKYPPGFTVGIPDRDLRPNLEEEYSSKNWNDMDYEVRFGRHPAGLEGTEPQERPVPTSPEFLDIGINLVQKKISRYLDEAYSSGEHVRVSGYDYIYKISDPSPEFPANNSAGYIGDYNDEWKYQIYSTFSNRKDSKILDYVVRSFKK